MRILCASALVASALLAPGTRVVQEARRPNIVLFFADDLGYGDLGVQGHPTIRTPSIDSLAEDGVRLTSFYSAQSCVPARIRLMTGRYPVRTGIRGTSVGGRGGIPPEELTLAESLSEAGYRTGMVGKWHLGYAERRFLPTSQGFDSWFGLPYSNDMTRPWVQTDEPLWLYEDADRVGHPVDQARLTVRYTDRAVRFIEESGSQPFFLYVAYSMPHLPLHPAPGMRGRSAAGLYGDVVETIDASVGRILEVLRSLGAEDNTLVVFTSDNGPWQHPPERMLQDGVRPWHVGSTGLLRGAKATTYEGGYRVPFVARWPGAIPPGTVSDGIATTMDLFTTFVVTGGGSLPDHPVDGLDLLAHLRGETRSPRSEHFYFRGSEVVGVRQGAWKLHYPAQVREGPWKTGEVVELFELDSDPRESVNRAAGEPEAVERLRRRMVAFASEVGATLADPVL
ncbi:MAG: sulfatase [Acidobacteriota bacterium]|nr:sulfatase [Acidobacteriota bacterium]